ncbi:DUF6011 domain-containing protein [Nonomuraea sp. GTA35]|uniref:DUF6011 domain-containing protein n=1 Tax=Nonomuraea sp. GTA35 TaxID=1676746 RepID=UPI0035C05A1F
MNLLDLAVPPLPLIQCGACRQPLWKKESRELGFGLDCAEKLGIIVPRQPRFSRRDGGHCDGQANLWEEAMPYIASGEGDFYHRDEECSAFQRGRNASAPNNYQSHPIREVSEEEAARMQPCTTCLGEP